MKILCSSLFGALFIFNTATQSIVFAETVRIDRPFVMRNQAGTCTCWLHSALQMMEQMANQNLSIDAILIPEIKSRALDRYLGHETPWDGGAGPTRPFALALEHGLVPESVWNKKSVLVNNYNKIYSEIELLLEKNIKRRIDFLRAVDRIILNYTQDLPPAKFVLAGREWTAQDYARHTIGTGASIGIDFRDVKYDDKIYGSMPDIAWTTIISKDNDLVKITDVISKKVLHVTAEQAWASVIRIFESRQPVAFTFIWSDQEGRSVLKLNDKREYVSVQPPANKFYTGSHLVLISGLIKNDQGQVMALEALDPLAQSADTGFRVITRDFFDKQGKTVHEIQRDCPQLLRVN